MYQELQHNSTTSTTYFINKYIYRVTYLPYMAFIYVYIYRLEKKCGTGGTKWQNTLVLLALSGTTFP
ncbi:hypothetical protein JPSP20_15230 [Staphylococcus pseudintermedius]